MAKSEKDKDKEHSEIKWIITAFIITFILSIIISFICTHAISALELLPAIIILIITIFVGILFDIVGLAVTVAKEEELHAKASKKVRGAKKSIKLIRNSSMVSNICADVIGDVCGVISGSMAALITMKITEKFALQFDIQFLISAIVASITVGGKAIGKGIAKRNSTQIVHMFGKVLTIKE
jgi:CBS domain containing-hemolysin-like protein